jgi:predicted nucleic acid-binding Zn ribbon protein
MTARDDDDDILDDTELPDESDLDDTDEDETQPCLFCGQPVYEQADVCPHCGNFISFEDSSPTAQRRYPLWILIGLLLALAVMVLGWKI